MASLANVDIVYYPLPQIGLENSHCLVSPDVGWNGVVVLQPPVRKTALGEG